MTFRNITWEVSEQFSCRDLKPTNFVSLFSVRKHNSSVFFQLKFYILSKKGFIKVQIWWNCAWAVESLKFCTLMVSYCPHGLKNDIRNLVNFHASSGKSENLHFDLVLLSIACKVSVKKVKKSYLSWHWRVIRNLKKNWLFVWTMTWRIWWILITRAVESLQIYTLMGYFCQKYVVFELKKVRRVMS